MYTVLYLCNFSNTFLRTKLCIAVIHLGRNIAYYGFAVTVWLFEKDPNLLASC